MSRYKTLLVLGLASVSPFSIAQQIVERSTTRTPHQPPFWFARLASPERKPIESMDAFIVGSVEPTRLPFRMTPSGVKYPCLRRSEGQEEKTWQFCDMP